MGYKIYRFDPFIRVLINTALLLSYGVPGAYAASPAVTTVKTILVATTGIDQAGCGSSAQPCRTIQYAVNSASSGDTILVAEGVYIYTPENDSCGFLVTPSVVCFVNKDLTINGGYSAENWTGPDPIQYPTIIDGQNQWRGVAVIAYQHPARLTMQGFTIRNGRAFGRNSGDEYFRFGFGGGIWAQHGSVKLKDMVFQDNIAYGGSSSTISNGGWALGGGLAIEGPSYADTSNLENISFIGNQALAGDGKDSGGIAEGGGLFIGQSSVAAVGLTFTSNLARAGNSPGNGVDPGRGVTADALGGAMAIESSSNASFSQIQATDNRSIGGNAGTGSRARAGAGLGGAIHTDSSAFSLTDSRLEHNQTVGGVATLGGVSLGGGVLSDKSQVILNRVKIVANKAESGSSSSASGPRGLAGGGGAYLTAFTNNGTYQATLSNCLFAENSAVLGKIGALNTGGGGGGALVVKSITANATHITFANNSLGEGLNIGQAIIVEALYEDSGRPGILNLQYSIITDHINPYTQNTSALMNFKTNTTNLSFVWFGNNTNHTNENGIPVPSGAYTLNQVWKQNDSAGFISPSPPGSDYHLRSDSPVIDLGFNSQTTIDLDNLPRPIGPVQDLGAYEFRVPTLKTEHKFLGFLVDTNQLITVLEQVGVNVGPMPVWIASTSAKWISLETSPVVLTIQIDPSKVSLGTHDAIITLSSDTAEPAIIEVSLSKVFHVYRSFLPDINH